MAEDKERSSTRLIIVTAVSVLAASIGAYVAWWHWHVTHWGKHYSNAGSFGDAFAPVTGLLSTLALAAAVTSVLLQRRELELQRQELRDTREVLAEQKKAQEQQAEAQAEANRIAEKRHAFDERRLAWERRAEKRSRLLALLQIDADLLIALEDHTLRGGHSQAKALANLQEARDLAASTLDEDDPDDEGPVA